MEKRIPEKKKKSGVHYAFTRDGFELPVIDITHEAFALDVTEPQLAKLYNHYQRYKFLQRFVFTHSHLGRGILGAGGNFLAGMSTYLLKLGPKNLGSFANFFDRQIAVALPSVSLRLRLRDMAHLMADKLIPLLQTNPDMPLHLINIAGGPAMDSLNALILIPKQYLKGRKISIHVLDLDTVGPFFGNGALAALQAVGAPLSCLDIAFHHIPYNWSKRDELQKLIDAISNTPSITVASSEGGLFEYGSDEDIVANLRLLRDHLSFVVGSVYRIESLNLLPGTISLHARDWEGFKNLAADGGWRIEEKRECPMTYNVRLAPS